MDILELARSFPAWVRCIVAAAPTVLGLVTTVLFYFALFGSPKAPTLGHLGNGQTRSNGMVVERDATTQGGAQIANHNGTVNQTNSSVTYKVHSKVLNVGIYERDVIFENSSSEDFKIALPSSVSVDARFYVLWNEASWYLNSPDRLVGEEKLDIFLRSSKLQEELKSAQAIICIGVSSSAASENAKENGKVDARGRELSNQRAFHLCDRLAGSATGPRKPVFLGVGLGHHMDKAEGDQEKRQRAVVLMGVRGLKRDPTEQDVRNIVQTFAREARPTDFAISRYARIALNQDLCWVSITRGVTPSSC